MRTLASRLRSLSHCNLSERSFDLKGYSWPKWGISWGLFDFWQSEWSVVSRVCNTKPSTTFRPRNLSCGHWMLHHDYAPYHNAISVKEILTTKGILVVPKPLNSPDLSPCNFFIFPKLKFHLKYRHFRTVDNIQKIVTNQWGHFHMKASSIATGNGNNVSGCLRLPKELLWRGSCWFLVQLLRNNFAVPVALLFRHTLYTMCTYLLTPWSTVLLEELTSFRS
jgi:hypothetical protein